MVASTTTRKIVIDIVIIALVALISFTWFADDLILAGGDSGFNYVPHNTIERYVTTWDASVSVGKGDAQSLTYLFPYQLTLLAAEHFGVPLFVIQRIQFYILLLVAGLGMYFFVRTILSKSQQARVPALFAALFYMFNPFALTIVWNVNLPFIVFYSILPFYVGGFIRGIRDGKYIYLVLIPTAGLFFSLAYAVLPYVIVIWGTFCALLILFIISHLRDKRRVLTALKFSLCLLIIWVALNSYWLVPLLRDANNLIKGAVYENTQTVLDGLSQKSTIINTLRLLTYPPFYQKFMEVDSFYPFADIYQTTGFLILSAVFAILAFIGAVFSGKFFSRNRRSIIICLILAGIAFFAFRGSASIFGDVYSWLITHFSWMVAFRNPIDKIGPVFVLFYTLFAGLGVGILARFLFSQKKIIIRFSKCVFLVGIFVFLVVVLNFPMWTGEVFYRGGQYRASYLTKVPSEYYDLAKFLEDQRETYRLFPVPLCGTYGCSYWWNGGREGFAGADLQPFVFPKAPVTSEDKGLASMVYRSWAVGTDKLPENQLPEIVLGLLNVRYVLQHHDLPDHFFSINTTDLDAIQANITSNRLMGIEKYREFGKLTLYRLSDDYYLPEVYAANKLIEDEVDVTELSSKKLARADLKPGDAPVFINNKNAGSNYLERRDVIADSFVTNAEAAPKLNFNKVAPGKYRITVENFSQPFVLTLSQRFDPRWQMYIKPLTDTDSLSKLDTEGGAYFKNSRQNMYLRAGSVFETLFRAPITANDHFRVNSYANGWWVRGLEETDKFEIILEFAPQRVYYYCVIVSVVSLIILVGVTFKIRRQPYGRL